MAMCIGLLLVGAGNAQVVVNEGFEANCADPPYAFYEGCFPEWISTHGSPDNKSDYAGISAYAGSKYAHAYVRYSFNCFSGTAASAIRGEGMAINYNFQAGVTYQLSYAFRSSGGIQTRAWWLTSGLPNQTGNPSSCDATERVPAVPAGSQLVHSPANSANWVYYQETFMPTSNFSQLWFRAAYDNPPTLNWEAFGRFFLDEVKIEILCDPSSGVAAYQFEDAAGQPTTAFCYGDDIYLDGSASENEESYYIDAWRRPIGSPAPFSWVAGLGWTLNQQVGLINLSSAFAANGYYFEPGYEYQIKLAISNPPCIPWTEVLHEFTLSCCTHQPPRAEFVLELDYLGNDEYGLYVSNYAGYSNTNATHHWIVLSSPSANSGPYTVVNTLTTTGSAPFIAYDDVASGLYYTVIHRLETACGDYCFGSQIWRNDGGRFDPNGSDTENCEFCGYFDCDLLDEGCDPPHYLSWYSGINGPILYWNPVPGVTSYLLEITYDDPDCCRGGLPRQMRYTTSQNSFTLSNDVRYDCFSFRVASVCFGRENWSHKLCVDPFRPPGALDGDQPELGLTGQHQLERLFPNPAQELVTLQLEAPYTGKIQLINPIGQTFDQIDVVETTRVDFNLQALPAGLYWVVYQGQQGLQKLAFVKQ